MTTYVILETMPEHLVASHEAAGNFGQWPLNGSVRECVLLEDAEQVVADDETGYARIVGDANADDPAEAMSYFERAAGKVTLDTFTRQYLETALWSSTDDTGEALDTAKNARNFAPEALARAEADCAKFQAEHAADIASDPGQAGHDFWLTRNGHGAGFWDGDWPEPASARLTAASQAFGAVDLCLGDDGKVYMDGA